MKTNFLKPFDIIAGDFCEVSPRELAYDLLNWCDNCGDNFLSKKQNAEFREAWEPSLWALAYINDEESGDFEDIQQHIAECIEVFFELPASTVLACVEDKRWMILPVINEEFDGDYRKFEECPEEYNGDIIYTVNDHGNTTCYKWYQPRKARKGKYIEVWSTV